MSESIFKIRNKKTAVFLICLGISAFLWLLIKLSKEYEMNLNLPLVYQDLPSDQTLINKPDSIIQIKLSDNGFDLIITRFFDFSQELEIQVPDLRTRKINKQQYKSYLLTQNLHNRISQHFSSAKNIRVLNPDSLILIFEKQDAKRLKIYPRVNLSLSAQYQLKQPLLLSPDSLTIFGSYSELSGIDSVFTEEKKYQEVSTSINEDLKLVLPPNIQTNTKSTTLKLEVEKFTEANITVPIDISFAKDKNIKIFPNQVQIKYAVSFEKFNEIDHQSFKIIAEIDPTEVGKLNLILHQYPAHVRVIDYSPKVGEYIIIK